MNNLVAAATMPAKAGIIISTLQDCCSVKRRLYHYTCRAHLKGILHEGTIEPRTDSACYDPYGVPPLVWASAAEPWEAMCSATTAIGPCGGLEPLTVPGLPYEAARIQISFEAAEAWDVAMAKCGCQWWAIMRLAQAGYEQDSDPGNWRACRRPVAAGAWLAVELWDGGCWQCVPRAGRVYDIADLDAFMATQG
ncbi:MAG: hypothetical protein WCK89_14845 [bacterium]